MFKYGLVVLLLALFGAAFTNAYITNIVVDSINEQVYVTSGDVIYEVDTISVQQSAVHHTPGSADFNTLFVGKQSSKKVLFAYLDETTSLASFPLPLKNQNPLKTQKTATFPPGLSQQSIFDSNDQIAVLSTSRNLTLVNLNTFANLDTLRFYQNRVFGINLVYNHQNKRLTIFSTAVPVHGSYGLSVDEFDLSTNRIVPAATTTYNCLCDESQGYNATLSPFFEVEFAAGSCQISYTSNPARIWCPYPAKKQLFSFNAANLADYSIHTIATPFDTVAWDFTTNHAYAIFANGDDLTTPSFSVSKVNLNNGNVMSTYFNTQYVIDSSVFALDTSAHHLYLAPYADDSEPSSLISLNTNNMQTVQVATLTA